MREFLWNERVVMIALLLIVFSASTTTAQQPAAEAREPVSVTGQFGDRTTPVKPRESEEDEKPGLIMAVARPRRYERVRRLRRDPNARVIKMERMQERPPATFAESRGGLELAREPSAEISGLGEGTGAVLVEVGEDDNKPGVEVSTYNPQSKRFKRDPKIKVMKGNRPQQP